MVTLPGSPPARLFIWSLLHRVIEYLKCDSYQLTYVVSVKYPGDFEDLVWGKKRVINKYLIDNIHIIIIC